MLKIENEYLKVEINMLGGGLASIYDKKRNEELLYQPDIRSWNGQDIVIFPFVGALKDSSYTVDGTLYSMKRHGLIRYNRLKEVKESPNEIELSFEADSNTLNEYPYHFEFRVNYKLYSNRLTIAYNVKNLDDKPMYFELGGHPAIKTFGHEYADGFVFENTELHIMNNCDTIKYNLNNTGDLITSSEPYFLPRRLILSKEMLANEKTLIIDARDIDYCILKTGRKEFLYDIHNAPYLAIWTKPGFGDFVCVEPWWGLPDYENAIPELSLKPTVMKLDENGEYCTSFSITYNYNN